MFSAAQLASLFVLAATGISAMVVHSHNDYEREVPLSTALAIGVLSVEADIWLRDETNLLVGHTSGDLSDDKTLDSLYIQGILKNLNGESQIPTKISVDNPLQLLIDFKTGGDDGTYDALVSALAPLRDAGHLTTWSSAGGLVQGAVTVVGTGETPLQKVLDADPRDIFYDAGLDSLPDSGIEWGPDIAPLASADWGNTDKDAAQEHVDDAHSRGIKTRFWNAGDGDRQTFLDIGSDFLNSDDLQAAKDWIAEHAA